jgi:hypothetical protein
LFYLYLDSNRKFVFSLRHDVSDCTRKSPESSYNSTSGASERSPGACLPVWLYLALQGVQPTIGHQAGQHLEHPGKPRAILMYLSKV